MNAGLLALKITATPPPLANDLAGPCIQADVPVINVSALMQGGAESRAVSRALVAAARNGSAGFFTITGHGLGSSMAAMQRAAKDFFSWPGTIKHALAPRQFNNQSRHTFRGYAPATVNGKELLDWTNPVFSEPGYMREHRVRHNATTSDADAAVRDFLHEPMPCPPSRPDLCIALAAHWERMQSLGELLLRGFAVGLGDLSGQWSEWNE